MTTHELETFVRGEWDWREVRLDLEEPRTLGWEVTMWLALGVAIFGVVFFALLGVLTALGLL